MKFIIIIGIVLSIFTTFYGQRTKQITTFSAPMSQSLKESVISSKISESSVISSQTPEQKVQEVKAAEIAIDPNVKNNPGQINKGKFGAKNLAPSEQTDSNLSKTTDDTTGENFSTKKKEKFHWRQAFIESGAFLAIQHAYRFSEQKTVRELKGRFFNDWKQSVKNLRGWDDGGKFFTNYIAHPLQGAATGRIFVNNSDMATKQEFGKSKKYWESRLKAAVWSAAWSAQFEIGPISEASLGNIGMRDKTGRSRMAWGDLIVTPAVGTGVLIGEDAIDKYILKNWLEKKIKNRVIINTLRTLLTPTTGFSHVVGGRWPWKRSNRSL